MTGLHELSGVDEQYAGVAVLRVDGRDTPVTVRLSARFEPVEGRYRWAGRAGAGDDLHAGFRSGLRDGTLLIGTGPAVAVRLGEPDPWGRLRLTGTGLPPWYRPPGGPQPPVAAAEEGGRLRAGRTEGAEGPY
ncbi:uncharacterized protein DUF4873 [Krasilnikovia cinnamomea]|uniref:Uncharacterized protein DUF4873 n=1 Tax=Krasilnikovia cinnamomea TaxID=349313 RepID=A0A4Q7ZD92_9ACTN|nr:DUF4873 domain-containing protein [Krasilnikovia cinnamomea]RZU48652.1 uncharacterized protein DUF4873 [Krasilnikovia cinnamomea]